MASLCSEEPPQQSTESSDDEISNLLDELANIEPSKETDTSEHQQVALELVAKNLLDFTDDSNPLNYACFDTNIDFMNSDIDQDKQLESATQLLTQEKVADNTCQDYSFTQLGYKLNKKSYNLEHVKGPEFGQLNPILQIVAEVCCEKLFLFFNLETNSYVLFFKLKNKSFFTNNMEKTIEKVKNRFKNGRFGTNIENLTKLIDRIPSEDFFKEFFEFTVKRLTDSKKVGRPPQTHAKYSSNIDNPPYCYEIRITLFEFEHCFAHKNKIGESILYHIYTQIFPSYVTVHNKNSSNQRVWVSTLQEPNHCYRTYNDTKVFSGVRYNVTIPYQSYIRGHVVNTGLDPLIFTYLLANFLFKRYAALIPEKASIPPINRMLTKNELELLVSLLKYWIAACKTDDVSCSFYFAGEEIKSIRDDIEKKKIASKARRQMDDTSATSLCNLWFKSEGKKTISQLITKNLGIVGVEEFNTILRTMNTTEDDNKYKEYEKFMGKLATEIVSKSKSRNTRRR